MYQPFEVRDVAASHPLTTVASSRDVAASHALTTVASSRDVAASHPVTTAANSRAQRRPCQWLQHPPSWSSPQCLTLFLRPWMSSRCLRRPGTRHQHLSWRTSLQLPECLALLLRLWMRTLRLRQCCTQHLHLFVENIALAPIMGAAPVLVVEDIAPAPAVSHAAPAPVGEYVALAPSIAATKGCTFFRASARCGACTIAGVSSRRRALGVQSSRAVAPRTSCGTSRTGVLDQYQPKVDATASLMEDFSKVATVNEVGMLNCAMDTPSSPYVRCAHRSQSAVAACEFDRTAAVSGNCRPNARTSSTEWLEILPIRCSREESSVDCPRASHP